MDEEAMLRALRRRDEEKASAKTWRRIIALGVLGLMFFGCYNALDRAFTPSDSTGATGAAPAPPAYVDLGSRAETIDPWPFTLGDVTLRCAIPMGPRLGAVTVQIAGAEYALNGIAKGHGYPDMRPYWRDEPGIAGSEYGVKVNIGPTIQRGLDLCLASGNAGPPLHLRRL